MPRFYPPPETLHGIDAVTELPEAIQGREWEDLFVVTDEGITDAGLVNKIEDHVPAEVATFDSVTPNPSVRTVKAVETVIKGADAVVALGGGSVMDAAKAATALPAFEDGVDTNKSTFERLVDWPVTRQAPRPGDEIPLVLIPTTAGTGSETGHWAVISDHEREEKRSVGHPTVGGELVVLDPTLTTSMPQYVTAASGFDVIAHAVEALVASGDSALTRPSARRGYELAVERLPTAVSEASTVDARADMLSASYHAGLAMNNAGLGAVHAISHAIGGIYDTPHGHTNALLVPAVVRRNAAASAPAFETYIELTGDTSSPGETLASELASLRQTVGLDADLPGLPSDPEWEQIADLAVDNINMQTNPVQFSPDTVIEICKATLQ